MFIQYVYRVIITSKGTFIIPSVVRYEKSSVCTFIKKLRKVAFSCKVRGLMKSLVFIGLINWGGTFNVVWYTWNMASIFHFISKATFEVVIFNCLQVII